MPRDDSVSGRRLLGVAVAVTEWTVDAVSRSYQPKHRLPLARGRAATFGGDSCNDDPDPSQALAALGCPNSGLGWWHRARTRSGVQCRWTLCPGVKVVPNRVSPPV